ncbi:carbohydrate esterase family 14 protein [Patellaria atrata CBS 101060]|uniref:N-acetylglucosaminylphosphatidylinositol deacetylase n=1 Tax=Patellaria atrata CBS 101060 TaxID=1346257 RepID=A0A9P4S8J2_9PEZI|nr:carbohydrate esterase family 14 protein [Patellaria atrata CBS 101060]
MTKHKIALIVGAHPDDCVLGAGGVSILLIRAGWRVIFLTMSDGELGGNPTVRISEENECARTLGVHVEYGHLPDGNITSVEAVKVLETKLTEHRPSLIFVHAPADSHKDHRIVSKSLQSAARRYSSILFYEGPSSVDFKPAMRIRLEACVRELKQQALLAHLSQSTRVRTTEWIEATGRYRAWPHFADDCCEAFVPLRMDIGLLLNPVSPVDTLSYVVPHVDQLALGTDMNLLSDLTSLEMLKDCPVSRKDHVLFFLGGLLSLTLAFVFSWSSYLVTA